MKFFWDAGNQIVFFHIIKIAYFRGGVTDVTAKMATLAGTIRKEKENIGVAVLAEISLRSPRK